MCGGDDVFHFSGISSPWLSGWVSVVPVDRSVLEAPWPSQGSNCTSYMKQFRFFHLWEKLCNSSAGNEPCPYGCPHPSTQTSHSCSLRVAHQMQQARHSDPGSLALQLQPRETGLLRCYFPSQSNTFPWDSLASLSMSFPGYRWGVAGCVCLSVVFSCFLSVQNMELGVRQPWV